MQPNRRDIEISRREVMANILRFKPTLGELKTHPIPVLLNTRTGDLRMQEGTMSVEEWRHAQLRMWEHRGRRRVTLCDPTDKPITQNGLEALAWRILQETVDVLNEVLIAQDAEIHLGHGSLADQPGWRGPLSRLEAEALLQNASNGTYILREGDEGTQRMAFRLAQENDMRVHAYVCTVVESESKISDILVLHTPRGWTHYRDNPDLSDSEYAYSPSPQSVMLMLHARAKHPLR